MTESEHCLAKAPYRDPNGRMVCECVCGNKSKGILVSSARNGHQVHILMASARGHIERRDDS